MNKVILSTLLTSFLIAGCTPENNTDDNCQANSQAVIGKLGEPAQRHYLNFENANVYLLDYQTEKHMVAIRYYDDGLKCQWLAYDYGE